MISKEAREKLTAAVVHLTTERDALDNVIGTINKLLDEGVTSAKNGLEVTPPKRSYRRSYPTTRNGVTLGDSNITAPANGKPVLNPNEICTRCKHTRSNHTGRDGECEYPKCWCGGFVGLANFAETGPAK